MPIKTTLEQIEEVQEAISNVMKSQEYQTADLKNKRAMLKDLDEREERLLTRYRRENRGSARLVADLSRGPI